jgi:mycothiol synthase
VIERPATRDDLAAVVDLFCRYEERTRGFPDSDESDLLEDWDRDGFDFATSTLVLEDAERVIGFATVVEEYADAVLDVDRYDEQLQERLVAWCEEHPWALESYVPDGDPALGALLERRGWLPARRFWRMRLELDTPTPQPVWPEGVVVRDYQRPADDRPVHRLISESFREIGGEHERTFEQWSGYLLETERFDPSLYLVAVEGDRVVGTSLSQDVEDYGFVRQLAVDRSRRGRGLALALLHESFRRHAERGLPATVLGVDAGNPTGALALYEKAGMRVHEQFTRWERPAP